MLDGRSFKAVVCRLVKHWVQYDCNVDTWVLSEGSGKLDEVAIVLYRCVAFATITDVHAIWVVASNFKIVEDRDCSTSVYRDIS